MIFGAFLLLLVGLLRIKFVAGVFLGWALVMTCVGLMWIVAFFCFGL